MMKRILVLGTILCAHIALGRQSADPVLLFEQKRFAEAKESFAGMLRDQPRNANAHYFLGRLFLMEQFLNADSAVEHLEQSTTLEPMNAEFFYMLGLGLSKQTQGAGFVRQLFLIPKVKSTLEKAIALDPHHADAHYSIGRFYREVPSIHGGDDKKAWKEAEILTTIDEIRGRVFKAWLWEKDEEFDRAEKELNKVVEANSNDWRAWNGIGTYLVRMKRYEEALPKLEKYCAMRPDTVDSYARLGEALLRSGEAVKAIANLKISLELDPYASATLLLLAEAFEQTGESAKAVNIYRQLNPAKLKQDQRKTVERKLKEYE